MRNISFFLTTDQIRNGTKTVTRRQGWRFLKYGEIVMACAKCQGLKRGQHIEHIRPIRIKHTRWEPLNSITQEDVIREGFPQWTPDQFIKMYCKHNHVHPRDLVNRIKFEYVQESGFVQMIDDAFKKEVKNGDAHEHTTRSA